MYKVAFSLLAFNGNGYTFKKGNQVKMVISLLTRVFHKGKAFAPIESLSSENGSSLKGKHLLPLGANVFRFFREDSFKKRLGVRKSQTGSHKSCLPCKMKNKIYEVYQVPLIFVRNQRKCVSSNITCQICICWASGKQTSKTRCPPHEIQQCSHWVQLCILVSVYAIQYTYA